MPLGAIHFEDNTVSQPRPFCAGTGHFSATANRALRGRYKRVDLHSLRIWHLVGYQGERKAKSTCGLVGKGGTINLFDSIERLELLFPAPRWLHRIT
jgi:hypothetical protein